MNNIRIGKKQKPINSPDPEVAAHCVRCGTCCKKGGPALHLDDLKILLGGHIRHESLITIRKGELALSPVSGIPEPIPKELVKISGKGKGWACLYYDEPKSSCAIYDCRPLECRLLKCWDTEMLLSVAGKDTLTRADIIGKDAPIMKFIEKHEKECPVQLAEDLISALRKKKDDRGSVAKLTALAHHDIVIRTQAVSEFGLSLEAELFFFGRPLFKLLGARGFQVLTSNSG
jgi:Fe-S-cluster containining protein